MVCLAGTEQGGARQHDELGEQAGLPPEGSRSGDHDPLIARCLAELAAHGEHRIGHHHQRQQLEAVQGGIEPDVVAELAETNGGGQQQQEGGEGEAGEGSQRSAKPGPLATDGKAELAGGGARQQLAEGQQLGEFGLGQPAPPLDKGALEVADMGGRPAKTDTAQPQKLHEYLSHLVALLAHFIRRWR